VNRNKIAVFYFEKFFYYKIKRYLLKIIILNMCVYDHIFAFK